MSLALAPTDLDYQCDFALALHPLEEGAFAAFVRVMWREVDPDSLEWAAYLDVMCEALRLQMTGDAEHRNLLFNVPPGSAKSMLVSVMVPAYEWLFNPRRRKLFFTADDDLSKRDSRRTRDVLTSPAYRSLLEEFSRRYGELPWTFRRDQNQKANFENSAMGFRRCLTLRTGVTGKRGHDWSVDDPIDVKSVLNGSPELIDKRCREANGIIDQLYSRLNDWRTGRKTLVMQRLHANDPTAHILDKAKKTGERWKHICLPMHYDPDHPHACPEDPRTQPGELLHPTRHTVEIVTQLAKALEPLDEEQLEQIANPKEGGRIKRRFFRERYSCSPVDLAETADEVWISVDGAKKAKANSDYHDMQVWAYSKGKRSVLDWASGRMEYPEFERRLLGLIETWKGPLRQKGGVLIEDTANGTTFLQVHGPEVDGVPLVAFHPNTDTPGHDKSKNARAVYLERPAAAGGILLPEAHVVDWNPERLLDFWCAFPKGKHDDPVDTASQINMRWTLQESEPAEDVFDLVGSML